MNRLNFIVIVLFLTLICSGISFSQYPGPWDGPIVIQIVELDHADADALARVLQPFLSKDGRITAYDPGNILIINDRKSIVEELLKVIKGRLANGD